MKENDLAQCIEDMDESEVKISYEKVIEMKFALCKKFLSQEIKAKYFGFYQHHISSPNGSGRLSGMRRELFAESMAIVDLKEKYDFYKKQEMEHKKREQTFSFCQDIF